MQVEVLDEHAVIMKSIQTFTKREGYSPSLREVANLAGFKAPSTALKYIRQLSKLNLVQYDGGSKNRTVRLAPHVKDIHLAESSYVTLKGPA